MRKLNQQCVVGMYHKIPGKSWIFWSTTPTY